MKPGKDILEKINGRPVVASVSGGKDSAAMSLYLTENGIEHDRVFADTGWEHPATYEYINGPLQNKIGPIKWIANDLLMVDLIRKKSMFPSRVRRFCTQFLKIKPISLHLAEYENEPINTVGIRAEESQARSKYTMWETNPGIGADVWRPLLNWTEKEVIEIHKNHGLIPNPLYLKGASRVGCWPCIFSRKGEIRLIADLTPQRIDEIENLENEICELAKVRYAKKGETFKSLGYHPPTFFCLKNAKKNKGMLPIREIIKWARTDYGGKQYPLFDDRPEGCVRWGMCEG